MSKIVCPYCFEEFSRGDVMFRCGNTRSCKASVDRELTSHWGNEHRELPCFPHSSGLKRMLGLMPDSAKCPECGEESFKVICPHCHNLLPRQMVKKRGLIISIVGARSSGKTNYITVLINELMRNCNNLGELGILPSPVADRPENTTQERYINDFYNILYRKGQCPQATDVTDARSRVPLIYEVTQKGRDSIFLVFYDTAGENFNTLSSIEKEVKFLQKSDATIFVMDTFNIPAVHDRLSADYKLPELRSPSQFYEIFATVRGFFEEHNAREQFKKPLAMVFTKIDAILLSPDKFSDSMPTDMSMERNSSFLSGDGVDLSEFESIHDGMTAALTAWGQGPFITNVNNVYSRYRFFGISALGSTPVNNMVRNLKPYRVLDPLVWILSELKYKFPIKK